MRCYEDYHPATVLKERVQDPTSTLEAAKWSIWTTPWNTRRFLMETVLRLFVRCCCFLCLVAGCTKYAVLYVICNVFGVALSPRSCAAPYISLVFSCAPSDSRVPNLFPHWIVWVCSEWLIWWSWRWAVSVMKYTYSSLSPPLLPANTALSLSVDVSSFPSHTVHDVCSLSFPHRTCLLLCLPTHLLVLPHPACPTVSPWAHSPPPTAVPSLPHSLPFSRVTVNSISKAGVHIYF